MRGIHGLAALVQHDAVRRGIRPFQEDLRAQSPADAHHRIGRASRFDCYIGAPSVSLVQDPVQSFAFVVLLKIEHGGCSYLRRRFKTLIGRADAKYAQRATH